MDNTYRRDSMKNQRNLFHSSPPRRSKVRFAPTYFLSATENKPSVRFDVFPHPNSLFDCKRLKPTAEMPEIFLCGLDKH